MLHRIGFVVGLLISVYSGFVSAATQIAPSNRVNLFLDSATPFTASDWVSGSSNTIGNVKVLKSTGNTVYYLSLQMPNLGISGTGKKFLLDSITSLGASETRISDTTNSATGQCVDFAKVMIGGSTATTSKWHTGTKLSTLTTVTQRTSALVPGTMIAYFNGSSTYPGGGLGHVAIVLSVASDGSGITVVDQNFINGFSLNVGGTIYGAPTSNTLLGKHFMPWTDSSARRAASEYHIVDLY